MTDIQQARDVLAKWRSAATPAPWELGFMLGDPHWAIVYADGIGEVINSRREDDTVKADDARLIVGTAGNPALLDAIDELLGATVAALEAWGNRVGRFTVDSNGRVARLAAAIIAADERINA